MGLFALVVALLVPLGATPAVAAPPAPPAVSAEQARVVSEQRVDDRTLLVTVWSPAVRKEMTTQLLLPDGWTKGTGKQWPTLWLLHGCCGWENRYGAWPAFTDVEEIPELRNVLVVMPDGGVDGHYSDWLADSDQAVTGARQRWESYHFTELLPLLLQEYGVDRDRQAIAGLSMGGFGALSYAGRHPDLFRAAASYSGLVHTLMPEGDFTPYRSGSEFVQAILKAASDDPNGLWGDPVEQREIWAAHNPYDLAPALSQMPVYVSAGNGQPGPLDKPDKQFDGAEQLIHAQSAAVAERLKELGGNVTTSLNQPGTHDWPYWERELHDSLPMLLKAIRD
ncbi:alpha/beta hydrolase [Longimycelium tulufanense]|nr:alpha/beta hydrolase family protein [Longimycelium tulufanense]